MEDPATDAAPGAAALRFLDGGGTVGEALRDINWAKHPLGLPLDWPAALKLSVSLCLRCTFPSAVFWGADLRIIHNDAWLSIADSDPLPLGCPGVNLVDVWPVLGPQFAHVMATGETIAYDAQRLVLTRDGAPAETFWSYNSSPIQDEQGVIRGVFAQGFEVTAHVLAERALRSAKQEREFILTLVEEQRIQADPDDVMQLSAEALGKFLRLDRVGFFEVTPDNMVLYGACWVGSVLPPLTGSMPSAAFGPVIGAEVRLGNTLVFNGPDDDNAPPDTALGSARAMAGMSVPLVRGGRWQGGLYVSQAKARTWTRDEIALVEEVAEISWDAVARVRAVARLRALNADLTDEVAERTAERDRLWEVSNDLLGIATPDGRWLAVNPAWEQLLGWREDEIVGRDMQWLRHPDEADRGVGELARLSVDGTHRLEKRVRTREGAYRTFAWQTTTVGDRLYATARDITEERRQQAAAQAADARTRLVLESVEGVGVWSFDVAGDRFESENGFANLYGFTPAEMAAGVSLADIANRIHPDDLPILRGAIDWAQRENGQDGAHEYRVVLPDGSVRWIMARNHVLHDVDGQPHTVVGVGVDITRQRPVE